VPVDTGLLQEIADRTGGRFYLARNRRALDGIFAEIDRLEKTELEVKRIVRYQETFQPLAWTALGLILLPLLPATLELTAQP
jgi:Ca-activated chloride channel family protein